MSRICGIEIKGKTACLVILEGSRKEYEMLKSAPLKIVLSEALDQESIKSFSESINDFFRQHDVTEVVVKEGISKGKFTSGSPVFKIETIIQMSDVNVTLLSPLTLNAFYKKEILDLSKYNLKKYQHVAFQVAYHGLDADPI